MIILHRQFKKSYRKLKPGERQKFKERRDLFLCEPFHSSLNNHVLHGKYAGYRSIDITGDLRVIYEPLVGDSVLFITIGTHHELYGR